VWGACAAWGVGCSSSSSPTQPGSQDASQPPPTKFEAGANCATSDDCDPGLACLFPATQCNALRVCVAPPPSPCDHPQVACSCLNEPIQVCDGYAENAVDPGGTCDGGAVFVPEAGSDAIAPTDAGTDATPGADASGTGDASDAAGD
jgi:hypothetical protein